VKLLVTADWHFTMRPPEGRTESYGDLVLGKLGQVAGLARKTGVDAVLCAGDLFHRKGDVTQRETQLLAHAIRDFGVPLVAIPGNHDAPAPTMLTYRAYGTLVECGVVQDASWGKGWSMDGTSVRVVGTAYTVDVDGEDKVAYVAKKSSAPRVHLVHGYLILDGTGPMEEYTTPAQIGETADVVVCGHYHTHQGARTVDKTLFVCPGSIARVTRSEIDNPVRVGLLEITSKQAVVQEWFDLEIAPIASSFVAPGTKLMSSLDAKDAAEAMIARGGGAQAEIEDAIEQAVSALEFGPEVVGDCKSRVRVERARQEGDGDAESTAASREVGEGEAGSGAVAADSGGRKGRGRKARNKAPSKDTGAV